MFAVVIRQCMQRFFVAIDYNPTVLRRSFNAEGFEVPLYRGRSYKDWQDALAYSLWFLMHGRIGSRADRNYLDAERTSRSLRKMSDSLDSYSFEDGDSDEDFSGQDKDNNEEDIRDLINEEN